MKEEEQCKAEVSEPPYYIYRHRCQRRGKYDGYCWQHRPVKATEGRSGATEDSDGSDRTPQKPV